MTKKANSSQYQAVWQSPPNSVVHCPWKALRGVDNKIFTIYNLQFTLLQYCDNISFILEAVWATFICSLVLLLNVSTFPFNSFKSLRSLLSAPRSAGLGYRGLWGSDCFFFDNNELERILWSFDAVFNMTQRTLKNVVRMLILFSRAKSCTCHSVFGSFFDGSISYCSISISYKLKLLYSLLAPFCDATDGLPAKWRLRSFTSGTTNQKHYPDMGSDTSSVWNFCAGFSDVISRGNRQWCREMLSLFSG